MSPIFSIEEDANSDLIITDDENKNLITVVIKLNSEGILSNTIKATDNYGHEKNKALTQQDITNNMIKIKFPQPPNNENIIVYIFSLNEFQESTYLGYVEADIQLKNPIKKPSKESIKKPNAPMESPSFNGNTNKPPTKNVVQIDRDKNWCIDREFKEYKFYLPNGNSQRRYYYLTHDKYTFDDAKEKATKKYKAAMVTPLNHQHNQWLAKTFGLAWLGVHDPNHSQNFRVVDESRFMSVNNSTLVYTNWYKDKNNPKFNQPTNNIKEGDEGNVEILGEHWAYISPSGYWGVMGQHFTDADNPPKLKAILDFGSTKPSCYSLAEENPINMDIIPLSCSSAIVNKGSIYNGNVDMNNFGSSNQEWTQGSDIKRCKKDINGIEYCPIGEISCSPSFEYANGIVEVNDEKQPITYTYKCPDDKNIQGFNWQYNSEDCHEKKGALKDQNLTSCTVDYPRSDMCVRVKYMCPKAKERYCANYNGAWKCSASPCWSEANATIESSQHFKETNKGFNDDGGCSGKLSIFSGESKECRYKDRFWGIIGGGCCKRNRPKGLGKLFGQICKEDEKILSSARRMKDDKAKFIGEYCSKKISLGFTRICVRWSHVYCVFASDLAREIHEKARYQLKSFTDSPRGVWGSTRHPNCRGFTPEEFQQLDFSKIDLSEYQSKLKEKSGAEFESNYIKNYHNKKQNVINNLGSQNQEGKAF